jgi:Mrp family chromosome partitioning ATPase
MFGRRARLPVLAEVTGTAPEGARSWGLGREDLDRLAAVRDRLAQRQAVLVTGAGHEAPAVAIATAGLAGAAGRRTVLVECDLARPRLAAALGLAPAPGVHEYLRWEASAPQLLQALALAGPASEGSAEPLVFIAAGSAAEDPAALLGLQSFRQMTEKLRHAYDLVVLCGPSVGAPGNTLAMLASEADSVLIGVAPGQVRGGEARSLRAALRLLAPELLGAVVVGAGPAAP